MPLNNDRTRLNHIIDSASEAMGYVYGIDRASFDGNRLLQHGIVRCVEIVGEASARLSKQTRDANPQVPWVDIIGMRNRIVHAYFDIDIELVWKTVTEDLPELLPTIVAILKNLDAQA